MIGTPVPSASLWPIAVHAPTDKSSDSALRQPGQLSAMVAWMVRPLRWFVTETVRPHSDAS